MKQIKKILRKFKINKNHLKKNILIVGSGRWGKTTIQEINKNFKSVKIFVYTKHQNQIKKWSKSKKINFTFVNNFKEINRLKITHAIVLNNNKDHYKYVKKLLFLRIKTLVEKPITNSSNQFKNLYRISKDLKVNLLVSLPFLYSYYFFYYKKFLSNKNIFLIKFFWTDKNAEYRNGIKKKHQPINFFIDILYHVYCIMLIFLGKGKITYNKTNLSPKINTYKFKYNNKHLIEIFCKRDSKKRNRIIQIYFDNYKKNEINFTNNLSSKLLYSNQKLLKCPKIYQNLTLAYQIFNFLNITNYKQISINDVRNLKNFLNTLFKIKKII